MSIYGFLLAWLVPNIVMAAIVVILNLLPISDTVGDLTLSSRLGFPVWH